MKILNVVMSMDRLTGGGTAERTFQMSRALARAGERCIILTMDIGVTPDRLKDLEGVEVVALPCLSRRFYLPKFSYKRIRELVKNADIVHLMSHWTFLNALIYFIARCNHKPYVVCPAGVLSIYGRSRIIKQIYNWIIGCRLVRNAEAHIAITTDEIVEFTKYGVSKETISLIPNGIDSTYLQSDDTANFRDKYGLGNAPFVLFVGRLNPAKGPDLLLNAFREIHNKFNEYHLVFAGPDQGMLKGLIRTVEDNSLAGWVHFLGFIGGEEKSQAYYAADLLVISSRREAMSIVVLEAGIAGTPVLITDQCGFNEVVAVEGGKVVTATVDGLQEGLIEMLQNRVHLRRMGENLRQFTCDNFQWNSVIRKYIVLYDGLLTSRGFPRAQIDGKSFEV